MSVRILALVVDAFGGAGGISQYNRDLISAWSTFGFIERIVVLTRHASPPQPALPEKVVQHSPIRSASLYSIRAIVHALRRGRFDLVFCGHLHMVPLAVVVSRLTGAPLWLQLHGIEAWDARTGFFRWCVERADLVTAVSRHTRRQFLRWANVDPNKVLILPNTVGEQFTPEIDRASAKKTFGLTGKHVLLTVSRLARAERYKGHERIIRSLPEIRKDIGDIAYVIAGDGDLRNELEELVRRQKLEDVVVFIGNVENERLPALYRAADVFVMPSSGEGFGIVYLEALACGTRVVAGDSDGARDPLHDGNLGMLLNEEGLAAGIARLLKRPIPDNTGNRGEKETWQSVRHYFGRTVFDGLVRQTTETFAGGSHREVQAGL